MSSAQADSPGDRAGGIGDRIVSGLITALGVYVIVESLTFDVRTVAGPWLVPLIAGALITLLGAWGVVRPERGGNTWLKLHWLRVAVVAAVLIAYVFVMPIVGFLGGTIALSVALSLAGPLPIRMRLAVCLAGTVAAIGLYALFAHVFNVPLPEPAWTDYGD